MSIALIDCNSFYCSCERVFAPKLQRVPLIVMSNNDGCAIARTPEVKALGIPMGAPIFKWRDVIERHGVVLRSANFVLYGDMSGRVNAVLEQFSPTIEIYSIDESFLDFSGFDLHGLTAYGQEMRQRVLQWTGLPTCVGIGPTKTLAKLANELAKKNPLFDGVCNLNDAGVHKRLLPMFKVGDVWGIGRATQAKLQQRGIYDAGALRDMPLRQARAVGGVVLERLVAELNGTPCHALEVKPEQKKGLAVTRSFGAPVEFLDEIMESIAQHTARCGEKLRRESLVAGMMSVFMHTSHHRGGPQYFGARRMHLRPMTDDTRTLMQAARKLTEAAYKQGFRYIKSGVMLDNLCDKADCPPDLFAHERNGNTALMAAMDSINARYGHMTLFPASQGTQRRWKMRQEHLSPRYTTRISDVPRVRAC